MKQTALLIVDVQTALIHNKPYGAQDMLDNICGLIDACHCTGTEVIYIQHDGGAGDELEHGCSGWEIYKQIAPNATEKVFEKQYNSAFKQTGLKDYLHRRNINHLILVGMQTEYCIDATCKAAFEHGFAITIPEGTTSTYDNAYLTAKDLNEYFTYNIWKNRYAQVQPIETVIKQLCQ